MSSSMCSAECFTNNKSSNFACTGTYLVEFCVTHDTSDVIFVDIPSSLRVYGGLMSMSRRYQDFNLPEDWQVQMQQEVETSLVRQTEIEAESQQNFDRFLDDYYAQYRCGM